MSCKLKAAGVAVLFLAGLAAALLLRNPPKEKPTNPALAALNQQVTQLLSENARLSRLVEEARQQPGPQPGRPVNPEGSAAWIRLGKEVEFNGMLSANQQGDGPTEADVAGGLECHRLQHYPGRPELYAYFKIDPAFKDGLRVQGEGELGKEMGKAVFWQGFFGVAEC